MSYRSAGTVEFVYDAEREEAAFLEVNTRLQVEHPVTEAVYGVDLVAWMIRLAQGDTSVVDTPLAPRGAAVEARVYAENPDRDHLPSAGTVTAFEVPDGVRVDTWIEPGVEVSTHYDPLLAKVIAAGDGPGERLGGPRRRAREHPPDGHRDERRPAAHDRARPRGRRRAAPHRHARAPARRDAAHRGPAPGMLTTVQDWPGRTGLWHVGIPPSGPMDDLSFRLGNTALGNPEGAPGLECTMAGPELRFVTGATVMVTGAPAGGHARRRARPAVGAGRDPAGRRARDRRAGDRHAHVPAGQGRSGRPAGARLGGDVRPRSHRRHDRRPAAPGRPARDGRRVGDRTPCPGDGPPAHHRRLEGRRSRRPARRAEFFTPGDVAEFYATTWAVHFNCARTGVRLVGPKPTWARPDGGEAGLHPSNIHDTPYAVGAVDYTGDLPILLGPDGPSLGGFTCPATVALGQLWKLGQLRPGTRSASCRWTRPRRTRCTAAAGHPRPTRTAHDDGGILARKDSDTGSDTADAAQVTYRRSGDDNLLVEYGAMTLDLASRMRVHALAQEVQQRVDHDGLRGIVDLTPGIRSLQLHVDPDRLPLRKALDLVREIEDTLPATTDLVVPSRTVHLPLSWDDPATREAIERYMAGVRDDAPWCPWNIEFIRRINGLAGVDDVYRTVFDASYLVMGLGDVYLGAPVATPLDPRHRLVTTKYNPARTWTPQNAVGIGGAYLCIYGMEGPGGYQFVGRTIQVWDTHARHRPFEPGTPWLLRFFDKISWYPVGADELLDMRADMAAGRLDVAIEPGSFSIAEHQRFLAENASDIEAFRAQQASAFGAERDAWAAAGEFDRVIEPDAPAAAVDAEVPDGCEGVEAPFVATVFRVDVRPGDVVERGQQLLALEAMKMEAPVTATVAGTVVDIVVTPGDQVGPGQVLVIVEPTAVSTAA